MNRRLQAVAVYLVYSVADGFLFRLTTTIFSVFLILRIGLDPLQLVLMGTILETTYLLFEVPTGVVADTVSRRLSVIIGLIGSGAGFIVLGFARSFLVAALSQVIWGIFATFVSGADVAWMTDEVGEERARKVYFQAEQGWHVGSLIGIAVSVALASISLGLPIVVTGVGYVALGVLMIVVMPEEHFSKPERAEGKRLHDGLIQTLREGVHEVRAHHVLLLILATAALAGASTEGFDRLADLHILTIGLPPIDGLNRVVWFGLLEAGGLVLGLGAITLVKHRVHLEGHVRGAQVLAVVDLLLIATVVGFGVAGSFWPAVTAFWAAVALRSARAPIFTAWINQGLDPRTRATINSMGSQSDAIGQAVGGPGLGVIAKSVSVPTAIAVSGLLRAPALLLYLRAVRRGTVGTLPPEEMDPELHVEAEAP